MRGVLSVFLVILMLATILTPTAIADDTSIPASITGKVTVTATQPTVTFALYSDHNYESQTTQITPQTFVYMKISVSGNNTLEEYEIDAYLFADTQAGQVGTIPATTSPETFVKFTIVWDSQQNSWVLNADTGGSNTWVIELDSNKTSDLPQPTDVSGDFYIRIKFGKTAREANTGDTTPYADWDIVVKATVASQATGEASRSDYTVFFYGETIITANTIDFGTIEAGQKSLITSVDGNPQNYFVMTVIANGAYDLVATSTSTWQSSEGYTITLTTTSPGPGQFLLQVDDELNNDGTDLNNPVPVVAEGDLASAQPFVDDASPTTESGENVNVYMKITLGIAIHTGTYEGTITLYAVDGS